MTQKNGLKIIWVALMEQYKKLNNQQLVCKYFLINIINQTLTF